MITLPNATHGRNLTENVVKATIHLITELENAHSTMVYAGPRPDMLTYNFEMGPTQHVTINVRRWNRHWYLVGVEIEDCTDLLVKLAADINEPGITVLETTDNAILFWFDRAFWAGRRTPTEHPTLSKGVPVNFQSLRKGPM